MADWGLLAGIGEGLKQGLSSYQQSKSFQEEQRRQAERDALAQKQFQFMQDKEAAETERQYRTSGFKKDETGQWVPDYGFLQAKASLDPNKQILQQLQEQKYKQEIEAGKRKEAKEAKGEKIPAAQVVNISEGVAEIKSLPDIAKTIEANQDLFGPVAGRLAAMNPYDERAQTVEAQMRTKAQAIGKFMEGGVLRKEDEEKYRKMLPNLSDTPEVAKNKLMLVEKMLQNKINEQRAGLSGSGYDVGGIEQFQQKGLLPHQQKKGMLPEIKEVDGVKYKKVPGGWEAM